MNLSWRGNNYAPEKEVKEAIEVLTEYVKTIAQARLSPLLDDLSAKERSLLGIKNSATPRPFRYIEGEPSPYLACAVYSYLLRAIENGLKTIRLGPAGSLAGSDANSLDDFSYTGEMLIPYVLETVRYDQVLRRHLHVDQEDTLLIIEIKEKG
jgi:hypothetical protein